MARKVKPPVPWPAWRYGPDNQSGIFNSEAEVPEGWVDSPDKVVEEAKVIREIPTDDTGLTDGEIMSSLVERGTYFNPKWPRDKLLRLLNEI